MSSCHGFSQLYGMNKGNTLTQRSNNLTHMVTEYHSNSSTTRSIKKSRIKIDLVILLRRWRPASRSTSRNSSRLLNICIEILHNIILYPIAQLMQTPRRLLLSKPILSLPQTPRYGREQSHPKLRAPMQHLLKQINKSPIRLLIERCKGRVRFPHKLSLITQPKTVQQCLLMLITLITGFVNKNMSSSQILLRQK